MKTADIVRGIIQSKVEELGYSIYDVEFSKQPEGFVLFVTIDSPNGITLTDCETVSREIEPMIDAKDPIEQAYYLCVTSIGIDHPLKDDRDYARNIGVKIDVKLYAPIDKKKQFTGTLKSYDADAFTIVVDGSDMTIARKAAASVVPHIDFD